jgi:serine/threonine protein kinase
MTLIAGRYHLLRKIASGGMAEVWLAEQRGPGSFIRRLVIKTIHPHLAEDNNLVTSFADEARLAALLRHPHIVRIEDFGEHNGRPYLVMEYLQGQNLKQLASLANGQDLRLPERLVLQLGIQMAEALDYAHKLKDDQRQSLGVVHRDVSPQNIMLMPNGTAKLVDFGIARAASNQGQTATGTLKGKLAYLSPEQAAGKKDVDHRADQFSLAVVLWELLIGSRLFASDSDVSTLKRVAFGDIPSLALYGSRYPLPLISAIDKALSRDRQARHADCSEFAAALRVCLSELGGAFSDTDYRAWLAQLAGALSVPKPLPKLSEEAVQATHSAPAVAPYDPAMDRTEIMPALADNAGDETLHLPAAAEGGEATEMLPALIESELDPDQDLPTRVSLKVVGTAALPSVTKEIPISEAPRPSEGQGKLLLSLLVSALAGVGIFMLLGLTEEQPSARSAPAIEIITVTPGEHSDQLSEAGFLSVVEANARASSRCLKRFGRRGASYEISVSVRSNGKPLTMQATSAPAKLERCLRSQILSWRFPAFRGSAVTHSFDLNP